MGLNNPLHIAFIVLILLLVFGARRLPEIGRGLGQGLREFKSTLTHATSTEPAAAIGPAAADGATAGAAASHSQAEAASADA